ncbi:MAG: WG repeat-containing protein [Bacteroidales bacterium]|nr:WG repeat-containing protein [Bacteroidales bacterium]
MKRSIFLIFALLCFGAASAVAQNPRAVIKAVYKGDSLSTIAPKYFKAKTSNPDGDPSMKLMDAVYLNAADSSIKAYYIYCSNRAAIESNNEIAKMLKSLQLRLPDVFYSIETASASEVLRIDRESVYDEYIAVASDNAHSSLDVLERARENCAYDAVMSAISIEECDRFLKKYPDALQEHSSAVSELRTDILFEEASRSTDEKLISSFIESYPKYARVDELKAYLADLNYSKVAGSTDIELLRQFVTAYPMHKGSAAIMERLSELEYKVLDIKNIDAVERFLATYPQSSHSASLRQYAEFERMIYRCNLQEVFQYIGIHGYDASYPRIVKAVAKKHGALILTPDIGYTDCVRFVDSRGRVGFWDMNGTVAVQPKYEIWGADKAAFSYDNAFSGEFVKGRNVALVKNNGRVGLVNSQGSVVVPARSLGGFIGENVTLLLEEVDSLKGRQYVCERYSLAGGSLGKGVYNVPSARHRRRAEFNDGVHPVPYALWLNDKAAASLERKDYLRILTRDGISMGLKLKGSENGLYAYNDRCISTDKGLVNTSSWSVMGPDPYQAHGYLKEGRIPVKKDGRWGYLDADMNQVIAPTYRAASPFCGGSALVTDPDQDMLIDRDGMVIFSAPRIVRIMLGNAASAEWDHYAFYLYSDGEGRWGVVDSAADVLLEPLGVDVDARTGLGKVCFGADGHLECTVDGKVEKYETIKLLTGLHQ